jgi:hypothetical protein
MMTVMIMMNAIGGDLHINAWMSKKNSVEVRDAQILGALLLWRLFGTMAPQYGT